MNAQTRNIVGNQGGFTLIEMAVVATVFALIMLTAFGITTQLGEMTMTNDSLARTQADIRAAIDEIETNLRSAGSDIEYAAGQRRFVYADAFQVAFNANMQPLADDGTGFPAALQSDQGGASVPPGGALYTATRSYTTGAETIILTLDSNGDGRVTADDAQDDTEEDSKNPFDFVLYRNSYGWDGTANTEDKVKVALVRGPGKHPNGYPTPPPLFSYFINHDDDPATPSILHGDANGNGELDAGELGALVPLTPPELARIERICMTVSGETTAPSKDYDNNAGYRRIALESEIRMRQQPRTTAVVYGRVYKDQNGNGTWEMNEPLLAGVIVRSSTGATGRTGADGVYVLPVPPGQQTITEIDPSGYSSSTPNDVNLDAYPGAYTQLDFGDISSAGTGAVQGVVFNDLNQDGLRDQDEVGIPGVKIYSDSGEYTYTKADGTYWLDVPVGPRTISKVDSEGYVSTSPNIVDVVIDFHGEVETANFAEAEAVNSGTVQGYVFLDEDSDGIRDNGEGGVSGADIVVGGAFSGTSDTQGFFSITVPAGTYKVTEIDPPGYTSTTPNTINAVSVDPDQTVTVYFGDKAQEDVDFDIIELADTERALSIVAGDLREDTKGDPDLVLGTRFSGGANNLLVWHNNRKNHTTPNTALFDGTPSFTRPNSADVTTLVTSDLDSSGEMDIVSGLTGEIGPDINVWMGDNGNLPDLPTQTYATNGGSSILDQAAADFNNDGLTDLLVGVIESPTSGHFEIWWGKGDGIFLHSSMDEYTYDAAPIPELLGQVTAVAAGDINGDGWMDAVVASVNGFHQSRVNTYLRVPGPMTSNYLVPHQAFNVAAHVTDVALVDMVEDGDGDLDILVAGEVWETQGGVELWLQAEDGRFGNFSESGRGADDYMVTDGAPLTMLVELIDNDIFPDLVLGTKTSTSYTGMLQLARTFGYLPTEPQDINQTPLGTVTTMTLSDFNLDNVSDFAVGTQNSSSQGTIYLLFRK